MRKNTLDGDHFPKMQKSKNEDVKQIYKQRLENYFAQKSFTVKRKEALGIKSAGRSPAIVPQLNQNGVIRGQPIVL